MKANELAQALLDGAHIYVDCKGGKWNRVELVRGEARQEITQADYDVVAGHLSLDTPVNSDGYMYKISWYGEVYPVPAYTQSFRIFRASDYSREALKALAEGKDHV